MCHRSQKVVTRRKSKKKVLEEVKTMKESQLNFLFSIQSNFLFLNKGITQNCSQILLIKMLLFFIPSLEVFSVCLLMC